ncbi:MULTISPECIES: tyrosine-type recombinase/integrase [unclassified Vibrio]|uniref:Tyrosine-type recombinase/integrase n=1 Tax=Vibrio sp. HB236076 TaxID=3232307 RepID=A0AB39HEK4_9VIBR|nr:tyrosine-type recombinase/integrase [Vibrio sp. HB161653]MDP5252981.1 tyrosine-type recombinase/integrase [Vibrio sp. HB161653]
MKNKLIYTDKKQIETIIDQLNATPTLEEWQMITQRQYTHNSLLALKNDWRRYSEFCQLHHVRALPGAITTLRRFIEKESKLRKFSSIRRTVVNIGKIHTLLSLANPVNHRQIKWTLQQLKANAGNDNKQATAMTLSHIEDIYHALHKTKKIKLKRDLAIYMVMFECALKRGELKHLTLDNVIFDPNHIAYVQLEHHQYQLSDKASHALHTWVQHLPYHEGPLFCAIDRYNNISQTLLNDSSIYRVMRQASDILGIDVIFSGQSTRVGAVQALKAQGLKVKEIQDFGRWLSPVMPSQYLGWQHKAEQEKLKFVKLRPWD